MTTKNNMYKFFTGVLHNFFPPEYSHNACIKILKYWPFKKRTRRSRVDVKLSVKCIGKTFDHPIGLSAGFDKNAECCNALNALGFSFVEVGTVTRHPNPGNPKPRLFRFSSSKSIINNYGLNSEGLVCVKHNLKNVECILGVSVLEDVCAKELAPYADYIALNVSCPSIMEHNQDLENTIRDIKRIGKPVFIKISPVIKDIKSLCSLCLKYDVGVIATNSRPIYYLGHIRGFSGPGLHDKSLVLIREIYKETKGRVPIIGVGGNYNGRTIYEKMRAGASLVQIYTGFVYEGPNIIDNCLIELSDCLKCDGFNNLEDIIGVDSPFRD